MTLQQKILAALAKSTSRKPLDTDDVRKVVGRERVLTDLEALRDELRVGHCRVILNGSDVRDLWWLAGNVESKLLPQTAAANRRTKAARAAKGKR